jgi:hypothetical protein
MHSLSQGIPYIGPLKCKPTPQIDPIFYCHSFTQLHLLSMHGIEERNKYPMICFPPLYYKETLMLKNCKHYQPLKIKERK